MKPDLASMASVWLAAAADLGIEVTAPFKFPRTGETCIAWVRSFGSAQGTVVIGLNATGTNARAAADSHGMYFSEINEEAYGTYSRALFIETLSDWGWCGSASSVPDWYEGHRD